MTICKICKIDKEDNRENWYFHKGRRFGLKCKECTLEGRKSEYEREMARERDKKRYIDNPERKKYLSVLARQRRKRKGYNPVHLKTEREIAKLGIRPIKCPICGMDNRIIAHHPDYSKPYEIVFCCQICHDKIHKNKIECPKPINLKSF